MRVVHPYLNQYQHWLHLVLGSEYDPIISLSRRWRSVLEVFFKGAQVGGEPGIFLIFVYFLSQLQRLRPLGYCALMRQMYWMYRHTAYIGSKVGGSGCQVHYLIHLVDPLGWSTSSTTLLHLYRSDFLEMFSRNSTPEQSDLTANSWKVLVRTILSKITLLQQIVS